jgi:hypothetical protein
MPREPQEEAEEGRGMALKEHRQGFQAALSHLRHQRCVLHGLDGTSCDEYRGH